jgi:F-type H+-transporting ATPase subunit epsilon
LFVKGGFAEVEPDRLTILAEKAIEISEFTPEAIASELEAAEAELAAAHDDASRQRAHTLLDRLWALQGGRAH